MTAAAPAGFQTFATWAAVLEYARTGGPLYYRAPLDVQSTRLMPYALPAFDRGQRPECAYVVRARTIRIWPPGSTARGPRRTADPFTADAAHLERFSRPAAAPPEYPGPCAQCGAMAEGCACVGPGGESGPFRPSREERLARAAQQAIPWLVLLGDYIGNGTRALPNGRCDAIMALRALGPDASNAVPDGYPRRPPMNAHATLVL